MSEPTQTEQFEYNAPTYVDFVNGFDESDGVDKFFDLSKGKEEEPENEDADVTVTLSEQIVPTIIIDEDQLTEPISNIEKEFSSPNKHSTPEPCHDNSENYILDQENFTPNIKPCLKTPNPQNGRRSRILFEALEGLSITGSLKSHKMLTRKDPRTPLIELRSRTVPRNPFALDFSTRKDPRTPLIELRSRTVPRKPFALDFSTMERKIDGKLLFNDDETDHVIKQIENLSVSGISEINDKNNDQQALHDKINDQQVLHDKINDLQALNSIQETDENQNQLNETVTIQTKSPLHDKINDLQALNSIQETDENQDQLNETVTIQTKSPLSCISNTIDAESKKRKSIVINSPKFSSFHINKKFKSIVPKSNPVIDYQSQQLGVRRLAAPKHDFTKKTNENNNQGPKIYKKNFNFNKEKNYVKVVETDERGLTVINKEVGHKGVSVKSGVSDKPKMTVPKPFSFYEKDKERFRKKEEKIQKIIEEEKKLAIFHANPVPWFVRSERKKYTSLNSLNMTACSHSTTCSTTSELFVFKAKNPKVLHQKPFIPRKSMKPPSEVGNFILHTEERSHQRDLFEQSRKKRELEIQLHLQEMERQEKEREEAAYRESRKSRVHKPLPMPKFK